MEGFSVAMLHYPAVMRKAQAELDAVVGSGRLPTFEDFDSLPYFQALIKEITRFSVVLSLTTPTYMFLQVEAYCADRICAFCDRGRHVQRHVYSQGQHGIRQHIVSVLYSPICSAQRIPAVLLPLTPICSLTPIRSSQSAS